MNSAVTVVAAGTRTTSGSTTFNTKFVDALSMYLKVTAVSGTGPTLDVVVSYVDPASGDTINLVSFTQANGATTETKALPALLPEEVTVSWTIGGTGSPSVTFSIGGLRSMKMK